MILMTSGDHYTMGYIQGKELKNNLRESIDIFMNSEIIKNIIPSFINSNFAASALGSIAYTFILKKLEELDKNIFLRIKGLADGSEIDINQFLFFQFFEGMISFPLMTTSACTTAIIMKEKNTYGSDILIKNYDLFTFLNKTTILRKSKPSTRLSSMELIISSLVGSHIGINETGLCISYNYGMVKSLIKRDSYSPTIICQYVLENFSRTRQVIEFIEKVGTSNGAIFSVVDEKGDCAIIESLGRNISVRRLEDHILTATNIFVTPEMRKYNYKDTDRYNFLAPKSYHNMLINKTSLDRLNRIEYLLKKKRFFKKLTKNEIKRILKDHNGEKEGNDNTICRHHEVLSTLASIIVNIKERSMEVSFGNPCKNKYSKFYLD